MISVCNNAFRSIVISIVEFGWNNPGNEDK